MKHLQVRIRINGYSREKIWLIFRFWPFDIMIENRFIVFLIPKNGWPTVIVITFCTKLIYNLCNITQLHLLFSTTYDQYKPVTFLYFARNCECMCVKKIILRRYSSCLEVKQSYQWSIARTLIIPSSRLVHDLDGIFAKYFFTLWSLNFYKGLNKIWNGLYIVWDILNNDRH